MNDKRFTFKFLGVLMEAILFVFIWNLPELITTIRWW